MRIVSARRWPGEVTGPALVVGQDAINAVPTDRCPRGVDPDRLGRVRLPPQLSEAESGVGRTFAEPSAEDGRRARELGAVTEIDGGGGAARTGMGAPVVRSALVCLRQGVPVREAPIQELRKPGSERRVQCRVRGSEPDEVRSDHICRELPPEGQRLPSGFGAHDRTQCGDHFRSIRGSAGSGIHKGFGKDPDIVVLVHIREIGSPGRRISCGLQSVPRRTAHRQSAKLRRGDQDPRAGRRRLRDGRRRGRRGRRRRYRCGAGSGRSRGRA